MFKIENKLLTPIIFTCLLVAAVYSIFFLKHVQPTKYCSWQKPNPCRVLSIIVWNHATSRKKGKSFLRLEYLKGLIELRIIFIDLLVSVIVTFAMFIMQLCT